MDQDIKTVIQYPVGPTEFDIPFDYLSRKFVRVSLVSDDSRRLLSNITEYRYVSKTRVKLLVSTTGFDRVEIRRFTSASERIVDFSDGSVLRATDLNVSQLQSSHIAEEARDSALMAMPQDDSGNLDARNRRIVRLADGIETTDAINKKQLDETLGEAGGILSDVKETQGEIYDYIEKFANDTALVRGVSWVYNNGSAIGGELQIQVTKPEKVFAVPYVEINGSRQEVGYHFLFDIDTQKITFTRPLKAGDFVMAMTTESRIPLEDMLASAIGASSIGTSSGSTVQAELDASAQRVKTLDALRLMRPSFESQSVIVTEFAEGYGTGGGLFAARKGDKPDDGGHIIKYDNTWYWERSTNHVDLRDYGVYLQSVAVARTAQAVNMAPRMQAAIARAIQKNCPLMSPFTFDQNPSYFQNGIVLTTSIDITGLRIAFGEFPLYANNKFGTYTNDLGLTTALGTPEPFVVHCKNAEFDPVTGYKRYGSNFRGIKWGSFCLRNVGDRSTHLNGIMNIFCHAAVDRLRAVNFRGNAVNMGSSYDYELGELGQEMSGDLNYYALDAQTYPAANDYDEHNSYTIHGVLSHYGYERGVRITGSKGFVGRVHDEGLYITSTAPFAGYSFDYGAAGGLGYTNNFIGGVGASMGEYSFDPAETNTIEGNLLVGCWGNNVGTIYTARKSSVVFHAAGTAGCNVGLLRTTGSVRINSGARTVINSMVASGDLNMLDASSRVLRINMAGAVTNLYGYLGYGTVAKDVQIRSGGTLEAVTVTGNLLCNQGAAGESRVVACAVGSISFISTTAGSVYLDNVNVAGNIVTSTGSAVYAHRLTVRGMLQLVGTNLNINVTGKSNFQNITFEGGVAGVWAFDIGTVVFTNGVVNWVNPTGSPRSGTTTTNPATGLTLIYTGSSWKTLIAAPTA